MTAEELYKKIGGNYEEAKSRLMNDALVSRFVVKFLDDKSYEQLMAGWDAGDAEALFKAAHTMKGVCGNLALTSLFETSDQITECFRPGNEELRAETDVSALIARLREDYETAIREIKAFSEQ